MLVSEWAIGAVVVGFLVWCAIKSGYRIRFRWRDTVKEIGIDLDPQPQSESIEVLQELSGLRRAAGSAIHPPECRSPLPLSFLQSERADSRKQ